MTITLTPRTYSLFSPFVEKNIEEAYLQDHDKTASIQRKCTATIHELGNIHNCMSKAVMESEKTLKSSNRNVSPIQIWDASDTSNPVLISPPYQGFFLNNFNNLRSTDEYFRKVHKRPSVDNKSTNLIRSFLHHPQAFNNAFWNPETQSIYYGNVDPRIFTPLVDNLEIATHELGHAVTNLSSNLLYSGESGALSESMSDVFAIAHKHYVKNTKSAASPDANWLIGDGIVVNKDSPNSSLRSMSQPGSAYKNHWYLKSDPQPCHMNSYVKLPITSDGDWGGVHTNSGIPNKAFYLAAYKHGGPSWDTIGAIWYNTLISAKKDDDFSSFAVGTLTHSKKYGEKIVNIVGQAWHGVGIDLRSQYQFVEKERWCPSWETSAFIIGGGVLLTGLAAFTMLDKK